MKTTRRSLFGMILGAIAAPVAAKAKRLLPATRPTGFNVVEADGTETHFEFPKIRFEDRDWHHLAFINSTDRPPEFWVDGKMVDSDEWMNYSDGPSWPIRFDRFDPDAERTYEARVRHAEPDINQLAEMRVWDGVERQTSSKDPRYVMTTRRFEAEDRPLGPSRPSDVVEAGSTGVIVPGTDYGGKYGGALLKLADGRQVWAPGDAFKEISVHDLAQLLTAEFHRLIEALKSVNEAASETLERLEHLTRSVMTVTRDHTGGYNWYYQHAANRAMVRHGRQPVDFYPVRTFGRSPLADLWRLSARTHRKRT